MALFRPHGGDKRRSAADLGQHDQHGLCLSQHLVGQFILSSLRYTSLSHQRRQPQQLSSLIGDVRRRLASQSSLLPLLGQARFQLVGNRSQFCNIEAAGVHRNRLGFEATAGESRGNATKGLSLCCFFLRKTMTVCELVYTAKVRDMLRRGRRLKGRGANMVLSEYPLELRA